MWIIRISLLSVLSFLFIVPVQAVTLPGPLVETDWLAAHRSEVVILDVRARPEKYTAKPVYRKDRKTGKKKLLAVGGHIPGAVLVDYKKIRATRTIDGRKVTRMLPERASFARIMQEAGVNQDSVIVITSAGEGNGDVTMATRLYWQLKYFDHPQVAILNGGLAQWLLEGRPVSFRTVKAKRGNWRGGPERRELLALSEDVAAVMGKGKVQLVDTRPLSQYFGTWRKGYVYARGHIPGARPLPNELLTNPSLPARFLPVADMKVLAKELGIDPAGPIITYCNSGHLASGSWFIFHELMGNPKVSLYDGSMHQWTLEKRPVTALKLE